jgi:hypothetical protein
VVPDVAVPVVVVVPEVPLPVVVVVPVAVVVVVVVLPPPVEVPLQAATAAEARKERSTSVRKVEVCMAASLHQNPANGP